MVDRLIFAGVMIIAVVVVVYLLSRYFLSSEPQKSL